MELYQTTIKSPLGTLQISCNDAAITALKFIEESAQETEGDASLHPLLQKCQQQLEAYFAGERKSFDLPIGQNGTPFQQKVWNLLMDIPFGKTLSYQTLSKQYGDVKAIRAIASANGKNSIAIIVPCHRVIGSNQSLTGYAGGLWRKQWLLEHESKYALGVQQLF